MKYKTVKIILMRSNIPDIFSVIADYFSSFTLTD